MIHTNTIRALPLVASMLGDRLGVKVDIGNRENTCTDGNTRSNKSLENLKNAFINC